MKEGGAILQDAVYSLNQKPMYGFMSPVGKIHGSQNQRTESGVASLTITSNDLLGNFVILVPTTLGSAGLETLATKEGVLLPVHTVKVPVNYKLQLLPGHIY